MKTIEKIQLSDKYIEELQDTLIYFKKQLIRLNPKLKYTQNLKVIIDFMDVYLYLLDK